MDACQFWMDIMIKLKVNDIRHSQNQLENAKKSIYLIKDNSAKTTVQQSKTRRDKLALRHLIIKILCGLLIKLETNSLSKHCLRGLKLGQ